MMKGVFYVTHSEIKFFKITNSWKFGGGLQGTKVNREGWIFYYVLGRFAIMFSFPRREKQGEKKLEKKNNFSTSVFKA